MNTLRASLSRFAAGIAMLAMLGACSSVSQVTIEQLRKESQRSIGTTR